MSWHEHAIWWHVYPLGAVGAPIRETDGEQGGAHRLGRLVPWLDHVVDLGCNGLLLGPVFASRSHGYDTLDHLRLDPRLGDEGDLDALVAACRERGLRVLLDGVFNHVSWHHPLFQRALREGRDGEVAGMFRIDWDAEGGPRAADFEGHGDLIAFNHDDERVVELVVDVMVHWLDRGVDGWRLDAAYAVPTGFWRQVLQRVRERHPDALVVGEVLHGDYATVVRDSGVDSVTQYELWKAIWSSLRDANFFELAYALDRHDAMLETFVPQTFVGNHDVTRIATQVGPEAVLLAATVLMTVGGMPSVYYGDELGYTGTKYERLGGDDEVRPVLPATPAEASLGWSTYAAYQRLIGLRRRHPWLVRARTDVTHLTNKEMTYAASEPGGPGRVEVTLDLRSGARARVTTSDGEALTLP